MPTHATSVMRPLPVGTLNYMAPESIKSHGQGSNVKVRLGPSTIGSLGHCATTHAMRSVQVPPASDIWSLGCLLYYLHYGTTPFAHLQGGCGFILEWNGGNLCKLNAAGDMNKAMAICGTEEIRFPSRSTVSKSAIDVMKVRSSIARVWGWGFMIRRS